MSKKNRSDSKSSPPQPASLNASLESSAAASIAQTVTERIGELMEEKFLDLRSTLDRLNGRIDDNTRRITESENRISEDEDRITSLENQVSELQQKVKTLTERCDDGENRSRRENIRIIGLKEGSEGQSSVTFFESWLPEVLGMETKRGVMKLDRAHRALGPPKEDRCRPVIIKLHNFTDKQRILTAAREKGEIIYKGSRIYIRQDFSAQVREARQKFNGTCQGVAILLHRSLPFIFEKEVKDIQGRYILLSGHLYGEQLVFGCVYAPNVYDPSFLPQLISDLTSFSSSYVLLGGDFNCVLDPKADMSPPRSDRLKKSEKMLEFLSDLNLHDVWRIMHPTDKDYSFFSIPHQVFTRIDYFFSSHFVLDRIKNCTIGTKFISDHAPVSIVLSPPYLDPACRRWRLNPTLLSSQDFVDYITKEWEGFIAINKTPEISPSTLWESGKAYIRGSIISYTSAQKKKALKSQLDLEKNIAGLEVQFRQHPSDSLAKQLEAARSALNQLLTKKAQTQIFYAKHRLFESGNKPGRLLARLAKSKMEVNIIPALTDRDGKRQNKSTDINKIMKLYYQDLYSSQCESSADSRTEFLDKIKFPTLSDEQKKILNNSISKEEVSEAISALKGGKAPGPDGFGPEFYKTFSKMLVGPLTDMFVDSFEKGFLPPTLSHAHVSVILKKDKPADLCGSYRPISLISVDSKVLSKLLARRLQNFLPTLVHPDQSGFVPGRLSHSNVRRLLNIIQFSSERKQKALAVSLDAEKAFDRIEWEYLFDVLHRFGLGGSFLRWIQAIYHSPTASVLTNGRCSEPFALARGVRQGCPLSPLLFALALEPLAETIRMQAEVKGISLGNMEHKIALYADDIILILTLPKQSIPTTLKAFNKFSSISGYKINFAKSEAMPLGGLTQADVPNDFPFKWTVGGLLYLGVKMSPDLNDMFKLNFSPICTQIKTDLQRWQKLPLSMLGRISLIKMNVLPRLLYPLQMLPLYISKKTNRDLEKAFTNFIWIGKKPRQKLKILQLHPDMGGLSVPNIIFYDWACHAHHYWLWLHTYLKRENCIDSWACSPHSPWGLITCDMDKIPLTVRKNPIIYNGIRVWRDVLKHLGKTKVKSLLSPITQNPDFPAGVGPSVFSSWRNLGINVIGDLIKDDTVMSFQQLQTTFQVPQKHFFAYLQLRHFISFHVICTSAVNDVEKFLGDRKDRKHLIGSFYSLLNSLGICLLPDISRKWEIDLDSQYIEDDWQTALRLIKSTFTCNRLRETQYRIIHRLHITPVILHKINRSQSPLCLKCNLERGTYFHCFWECRKISRFWNHISSVISDIFKLKIKRDPGVFLLGLPSRKLQIPTAHYKLLEKLLLIARKCILIHWIKESPPTVTLWYREVFCTLPHERLHAVMEGREEMFLTTWTPFLNHLPADLKGLLLQGQNIKQSSLMPCS
uniref:Reverse transcriptase domain-containing protein n=1 Tax=Oryzias latipes TaxID=8090 RepID=A0A3P9IJZ9_ORYLA